MATNIPPTPTDAERFACENVIANLLRTELAAWFHDIIRNQMVPNHPGYTKLINFPIILYNSLEKTKELYNIQSVLNVEDNKRKDITPENFYYEPLFQSHELWHTMASELQILFRTMSFDPSSWGQIIKLHENSSSSSGRLLISLILSNQVFPVILNAMKANTERIICYINEANNI